MNEHTHSAVERAAGSIDEAGAAIGAALCTSDLQGAIRGDARDVHRSLQLAAETLRGSGDVRHHLTGLMERLQLMGVEQSQGEGDAECVRPGVAPGGGHSLAAGLLRLARAVVRRAEWCVADLPHSAARDSALECLAGLPTALEIIARRADEEEANSIPVDFCGVTSPNG